MFPFIYLYKDIFNVIPESRTLITQKFSLIYRKRSSCRFIVPQYVPDIEI